MHGVYEIQNKGESYGKSELRVHLASGLVLKVRGVGARV